MGLQVLLFASRSHENRGPLRWPSLASVHTPQARALTHDPEGHTEEESNRKMEQEATDLHRGLNDLRYGERERLERPEHFEHYPRPGVGRRFGVQRSGEDEDARERVPLEEEMRKEVEERKEQMMRQDEERQELLDVERIRDEYEQQARQVKQRSDARLMSKDREVKDLRASRAALKEQLRAATRERNDVVAQESKLVEDLKQEEQREEREEHKVESRGVREDKAVGRKVQLVSTAVQAGKHDAHQQELTSLGGREREVRAAAIAILQQQHLQKERDEQVPMQAQVPVGVSQGQVFPVKGRTSVLCAQGSFALPRASVFPCDAVLKLNDSACISARWPDDGARPVGLEDGRPYPIPRPQAYCRVACPSISRPSCSGSCNSPSRRLLEEH